MARKSGSERRISKELSTHPMIPTARHNTGKSKSPATEQVMTHYNLYSTHSLLHTESTQLKIAIIERLGREISERDRFGLKHHEAENPDTTPLHICHRHRLLRFIPLHLPPLPPLLRRPLPTTTTTTTKLSLPHLNVVDDDDHRHHHHPQYPIINYLTYDSVLLPDWELLLLIHSPPPPTEFSAGDYYCVFQNEETSPAKLVGPAGLYFKCEVPASLRSLGRIGRPALRNSRVEFSQKALEAVVLRWSFLVYESLSTETDVILFVKGVSNRQGTGRPIDSLRCVFSAVDGAESDAVRTNVTRSFQEVIRCEHPDELSLRRLVSSGGGGGGGGGGNRIRVSLEILDYGRQRSRGARTVKVPSVAYYSPVRTLAGDGKKSLLCACTMVHNVAKFLKEWVMYHSHVGVERFILYDNDSSDDLFNVVDELNNNNNNNNGSRHSKVDVVSWPWPKAQEAGFSHSAIYAKSSCTWMMYMDVDEFVFSPSWMNSSRPSTNMITSLLPKTSSSSTSCTNTSNIGQVMIKCLDFGPSGRKTHPKEGVMQGYTCRRKGEERHKSMVKLEAIDDSLGNVVHHFELKKGYEGRNVGVRDGVVNHYKYQAWSEFKDKFRRRVSTFVVDWREEGSLNSKDRTPGLGFEAVEPEGWADRFCEVKDDRLKRVSRGWFGYNCSTSGEVRMAWQY
ncbi:hypothetical protein Sjap_017525 [Stephania japonica]|uniref:Glycosyltransferase family 92 protein n=1 Tax=Stephania japonica TaxID=461633 RepID=A0AAP0NKG9_9MAGN